MKIYFSSVSKGKLGNVYVCRGKRLRVRQQQQIAFDFAFLETPNTKLQLVSDCGTFIGRLLPVPLLLNCRSSISTVKFRPVDLKLTCLVSSRLYQPNRRVELFTDCTTDGWTADAMFFYGQITLHPLGAPFLPLPYSSQRHHAAHYYPYRPAAASAGRTNSNETKSICSSKKILMIIRGF